MRTRHRIAAVVAVVVATVAIIGGTWSSAAHAASWHAPAADGWSWGE